MYFLAKLRFYILQTADQSIRDVYRSIGYPYITNFGINHYQLGER